MNRFSKLRFRWVGARGRLFLIALSSGFLGHCIGAGAIDVRSPDGQIQARVTDTGGNLAYSVFYRGSVVLENARLGLLVNGNQLGVHSSIIGESAYSTDEPFVSRHGIHRWATNNYAAKLITISDSGSASALILNFRAYNDGLAFRYEFPSAASRNITGEETRFVLPSGSKVWAQSGISVYENIYTNRDIAAWEKDAVFGPPVVVELSDNRGLLALTESTVGMFGNPYLRKAGEGAGRELQVGYPVNLTGGTGVTYNGAISTPWNVVMIASNLNGLINNDIVESLAPPPDTTLFSAGPDTVWVKPGRSVWDWLRPQPGGITAINAMTNSLWASRLGFEFNTIDEGWGNWNGGNPWPEVEQVVTYSHGLGVRVLLWKRSAELATASQRSRFFAQLSASGVDGFKADFFDFNGASAAARERVQLQEAILKEAASYKLLVNFHGSSKPTGQFRTYPNLLNVEAVFGKEQWLSSLAAMPAPFTRFLAGPADFTPMEFGGNKAYEIASAINMPAPLLTYAERSDTIARSPFAALIREIPCMWDETIVLPASQLGLTVATARKSGTDWFLGIMNTATARSWQIPLSFLAPNQTYQAQIIREGSTTIERMAVTRETVLPVGINSTGGSGFAARFFIEPALPFGTNELITGQVIGTAGSWSGSGNTKEKAFDGNLTTYFDAPAASGAWAGLDLGANKERLVMAIRFCPRSNWAGRMVGGRFEASMSSDFSDATVLHTVGYTPAEAAFTTVFITNRSAFRYLRYVSPPNGSCNVAEIQFYTAPPARLKAALKKPGTLNLSWDAGQVDWRLQSRMFIPATASDGWTDVPAASNHVEMAIGQDSQSAFFRLVYP